MIFDLYFLKYLEVHFLFIHLSSLILSSFFYHFTFFIPIFLDFFLIFSIFFFKGPINSIEVFIGFNPCYSILFNHFFSLFFQIQFIIHILYHLLLLKQLIVFILYAFSLYSFCFQFKFMSFIDYQSLIASYFLWFILLIISLFSIYLLHYLTIVILLRKGLISIYN